MKKINCGGFYINENDFSIDEEGKLNLKPNGGGNGYTVEETRTVIIPEQTVTTETGEDFPQVNGYFANVTSSAILPETFPDTILLTADGVEYQLPKLEFSEGAVIAYGEIVDMSTIDWSNYPVQVMCIDQFAGGHLTVFVVTENAGTYTVKAEYITKSMTVSPEFQEAVAKITEPLVLTLVPSGPAGVDFLNGTYTGATPEEVLAAWNSGRTVTAKLPNGLEARFLGYLPPDDDDPGDPMGFLIGYSLYGNNFETFLMYTLSTTSKVYNTVVFSGLTPIGD